MSRQEYERLGGGKAEIPLDDDLLPEPPQDKRPGLLTIVLTLLVLLAMLTSLVWPLLYYGPRSRATPTPTPTFLQEAHAGKLILLIRI